MERIATTVMTLCLLLAGEGQARGQIVEACSRLTQILEQIEKDADKLTNQLSRIDSRYDTWCEFGRVRTVPQFEGFIGRIEENQDNPCFGASEQSLLEALRKHLLQARRSTEADCTKANRASRTPAAEGQSHTAMPVREAGECIGPVKPGKPGLYRVRLVAKCRLVRAAFKSSNSNGTFLCRTAVISPSAGSIRSKRGFAPKLLGACYLGADCTERIVRATYCNRWGAGISEERSRGWSE